MSFSIKTREILRELITYKKETDHSEHDFVNVDMCFLV